MSNKPFPKKYKKKLDEFAQGYEETAESASTDELKKFILTAEQNIYEIENEKENNEALNKLREDLKESLAPYNEAKTTEKAKIQFCLWLLQSRDVKI